MGKTGRSAIANAIGDTTSTILLELEVGIVRVANYRLDKDGMSYLRKAIVAR